MKVKKILCPVDFSDCSKQAFPYAKMLAESLGAEVMLLHVFEPYVLPLEYGLAPIPFFEIEAEAKRNSQTQLDQIAKEDFSGVKVTSLIGAGRSSDVILQTVKTHEADMIVLSTHGRTGLSHAFMGSTAEKVVRTANCPVLTVRSQAKR